VRSLSDKTEISVERIVGWLGIARSKFYSWMQRYGKANEHNALIPRDHWLLPEEKQAILDFHEKYPMEGYRRLCFMMLDREIVACSPASVYRVLSAAGRLDRWNKKPSKKGTGFVQPLHPHEHWHIDITYLNIVGVSIRPPVPPSTPHEACGAHHSVARGRPGSVGRERRKDRGGYDVAGEAAASAVARAAFQAAGSICGMSRAMTTPRARRGSTSARYSTGLMSSKSHVARIE
jgi:hypothetical protein